MTRTWLRQAHDKFMSRKQSATRYEVNVARYVLGFVLQAIFQMDRGLVLVIRDCVNVFLCSIDACAAVSRRRQS